MSVGRAVGIGPVEVQALIDEDLQEYLPLVDGVIPKELGIGDGTNSPTVRFDSGPNHTSRLLFEKAGEDVGRFTASDTSILLQLGSFTSALTKLVLYADRVQADKEIVYSQVDHATLAFNALTPRGYVDAADAALQTAIDAIQALLDVDDTALDTLQEIIDRIKAVDPDLDGLQVADVAGLNTALAGKLDTSGGTLDGNLTIAKAGGPRLVLKTLDTDSPQILFENAGGFTFQVYYIESADRVTILKRDTSSQGGGGQHQFHLYSTYARFDKEVRTLESTTAASDASTLTTKGFVDANFLNTTQNATHRGILFIKSANASADSEIRIQANPARAAIVRFYQGDALKSWVVTGDTSITLRYFTGGAHTELQLTEGGVGINKNISVSGAIEGQRLFLNSPSPRITLAAAADKFADILFTEKRTPGGVEGHTAYIYHDNNNEILRFQKRDIDTNSILNEFQLRSGYANFSKDVRTSTVTTDASATNALTTKDYVDAKLDALEARIAALENA